MIRMIKWKEIDREWYGGAGSTVVINHHSTRTYEDLSGNKFILDRIIDTIPKYFSLYGPIKPGYTGVLPVIKVCGKSEFGFDATWRKAIEIVSNDLQVEIYKE